MNRGKDPTSILVQASKALETGIKSNDQVHNLYDGLATTQLLQATYQLEKGQDPWKVLEKALSNYDRSLHLNPGNFFAFTNIAECFWVQARYLFGSGQNGTPALKKAFLNYEKSEELNPNFCYGLSHHADAFRLQAEFEYQQGIDPRKTLKTASTFLARALRANPNDFWTHLVQGKCHLLIARYLLSQSKPADEYLAIAKNALENSKNLNSTFAETFLFLAVQLQLKSISDSSLNLYQQAIFFINRALELNQNYAEALVVKAELQTWQAKQIHQDGPCMALCQEAIGHLNRAFSLNPNLRITYADLVQKTNDLTEPKNMVH